MKLVAEQNKVFIVSPEVFEVLNKLLKLDEENATGDVQILFQLFSEESLSYRFAMERTHKIPSNILFSTLGSTQVPYSARLLCRMDQGHGLLDHFMFMFPICLRPAKTGFGHLPGNARRTRHSRNHSTTRFPKQLNNDSPHTRLTSYRK